MVAGIQGSRMDDQRAEPPLFPGLRNGAAAIEPYRHDEPSGGSTDTLNDQFFDMLVRCQVSGLVELSWGEVSWVELSWGE